MRHNFVVIFQSSYFDLIYFSVCEYTKESFKTVAKDQLEADFLRAGYRCNIHELFQRIVSWRQSKGLNLFNFETVKFEHHWQDSQSDENVDTDRMPLDSLEVGESNSSGEGTKHQSVFPDSQITAEQSATNESTGFQLSGAHLPSQIFLSSVKLNSPFGEVSKIVPIILPSDLRRLQCSKLNALNAPTNVVCSEIESDELPLSRVDTQSLTEVLSTLRRLQQLGQTSSGVLEDQLKGSAVSVTETQTNLDQLNVFQKAHDDGSTETIFNFEFESSREHTAEQLQSKASNASGSTNIATGSKLPCVAQRTAEQLQSVILQEDQSTYAGSIRPHHEILVLEQKDNSELEHDTSVLEVSTPGISTNQLTASQYTEHVAEVSDFAEFFGPNKLRSLLEGTVTGKELINRAHQGPLSNQSQAELISILSEYHISTKGKVTEEILKIYTLAITLLFKHEKKEIYFTPRGNGKRNPGGKLYNGIVNTRQKFAKRKLKEKEHLAKKKVNLSDSPQRTDLEGEEALNWLKLNTQPWATTLEKWAISFKSRQVSLPKLLDTAQIWKSFPHYTEPFGYQLIDIDFVKLHGKEKEGSLAWDRELEKLVELVSVEYKDKLSAALSDYLKQSSISRDSKICSILILLNNHLRPTKITKTFKPTILVAQEDTVLFVETETEIEKKLQNTYANYANWNFTQIAKLVFVGSGAANLSGKFFVCYDDLSYQVETVERAIDVLIKFNTVFELEYSRVNRMLWNFLCRYLYKIPCQATYASVDSVIAKLSENN
ncbi:uncharacterized protein LOC131683247 isoform X2 [Topomyia yanbarensis]|uniref:uncharacterized protein LOC131683247 isoform X2 n=1 Tax=Topomyia yanbarensis TaxID=2498891 RepID=UPI00273ACEB3|nr:uncharacterized protein LOC131683247 isoform X2 [Topomyia yanbarensis]